MGRRRKQHERLLFGATPWWLYALLEEGYITGPEYVVWTVIRGYVKNEAPEVFSPPLIDLANRELARATALTPERIRELLKSLEDKQLLYRVVGEELRESGLGGNRWILLLAPQDIPQHYPQEITGGNITRGNITPGINNNTRSSPAKLKKSSRSTSEDDVVVESRPGEGGMGGEEDNPQEITGGNFARGNNTRGNITRGNITRGNITGGNNLGETRQDVAETLRELHVFTPADFTIADKMLADPKFSILDGEALLTEVRATFFRVFNQEREHARNDVEAMRFTVNRLKAGDWGEGLDAVLSEADEHKRNRYADLYTSNAPPTPQPGTAAEAQAVWSDVLEILASQVTRVNYDTWLRDTVALGLSSTRMALIVQAADEDVVEALSEQLSPAIERALNQTLESAGAEDLDLDPDLLRVVFVTEAMLPERPRQWWEDSPYDHAQKAHSFWQAVLGNLKGQMTRATFDEWLRNSQAMGINGEGQTLVIRVKNDYAIEWLENRLYNVVHRTLIAHLEFDDEGKYADLGLAPETVALHFVTPEMLAGEDEHVDA